MKFIYHNLFFQGLLLTLCFSGLSVSAAWCQNNLKEIPSADVQRQLDMFQITEGFEIDLFAAEPMVVKPIQMNWDAHGRLWVVSSTVYPHLRPGEEPNDKIYVLEDSNGDGKADKSTVFATGLITPTGILPGDGGVYVANSTELLHLKDTNGDGKADQRKVILSGFGTGDTHHLIHTFRWGPDGLMYFNQSIYIYSHVETPFGTNRLHGGGVWQFNPQTLELKVFARGLINPWGLQFDEWGSLFLTDGAGLEGINYGFRGATFISAPGAEKTIRGLNPGQPKHSGLDIITGDHFPASWQGRLVTNDFRANRINTFKLAEQGSGFVSNQAEDLLWTDHIAFRPVDILEGPDGALYVADWYNPIIQHGEVDFHDPRRDQAHGRIWRISAKGRDPLTPHFLKDAGIQTLLDALKAKHAWTRIQSKQLLKEKDQAAVLQELEKWVNALEESEARYEHHLIEALWVYELMGKTNVDLIKKATGLDHPRARAAAFRLLGDGHREWEEVVPIFLLGVNDPHAQVRKEAVISLEKFPNAQAAKMALGVLDKGLDEFSAFALWNTLRELEPYWLPEVIENPSYFGDTQKTAFALKEIRDPNGAPVLLAQLRKNTFPENYRSDALSTLAKIADEETLSQLWQLAVSAPNESGDWIRVLFQAASSRGVKPKGDLMKIQRFFEHEDMSISLMALQLAGYWQLSPLNQVLVNLAIEGTPEQRQEALQALARLEDPKSQELLRTLTGEKFKLPIRIRATALLARNDRQKAAQLAKELLVTSPNAEEAQVLFAAMMRDEKTIETFTASLLDGGIPEGMAKLGRQSMSKNIPWHRQADGDVVNLKKALEASGGVLPPERMPQNLNERQLTAMVQEVRTSADAISGEAIYRRKALICQNCHAIGGAGGQLGPDLSSLGTSSPVDEIMRSILEPTASIKEGYELQRITKHDGGILMGYLVNDGADELVLRNAAGMEENVAKSQVKTHDNVPGSLMPPGLTSSLERQEFVDLVGYLSKLGKPGEFRVPNKKLIRRWRTAFRLPNEIQTKEGLAKQVNTLSFQPAYSRVSGDLPMEEVSVLQLEGKTYQLVSFELEVLQEGEVQLSFNESKGLFLLQDDSWSSITQKKTKIVGKKGNQEVYLLIVLEDFGSDALSIEVVEEASTAQTRLVMGM